MGEERLQKLISECGLASRRKAEDLIIKGKVKVNGRPSKLGDKADIKKDIVTVDGIRIKEPRRLLYIMLNKPRGYVTAVSDRFERKCVTDLVADVGERVYPVGRLDKDSEGLLLLTNDGRFANSITHPAYHIPKTYRATLKPGPDDRQISMFKDGMMLEGESKKTAPADIKIIDGGTEDGSRPQRAVAEIVLYEGRNRQIRRMFGQMGIEVARLRRTAIGSVKLGMLAPGKWRELDEGEVRALKKAGGGDRELNKQEKFRI